jgi:dTDP-glucose 4,6-dehydratase
VIPTVITQIASGQRTIRLGATHPTRDFSFVADTAAGFIAALRASGTEGEVINVGSGFEISIGNTARAIAEIMKADIEIVSDDQRVRPAASEVERLFAGTDKARRLLGWSPKYGGLDGFKRGLAATVEWFSMPNNLARYKAEIYNL